MNIKSFNPISKLSIPSSKKNFMTTVLKSIYRICENDPLFKKKEIESKYKKIKEWETNLKHKELFIEKLVELQIEISKSLKVLDMENTSKTEDLLYKLGGEEQ